MYFPVVIWRLRPGWSFSVPLPGESWLSWVALSFMPLFVFFIWVSGAFCQGWLPYLFPSRSWLPWLKNLTYSAVGAILFQGHIPSPLVKWLPTMQQALMQGPIQVYRMLVGAVNRRAPSWYWRWIWEDPPLEFIIIIIFAITTRTQQRKTTFAQKRNLKRFLVMIIKAFDDKLTIAKKFDINLKPCLSVQPCKILLQIFAQWFLVSN